MNFSVLAVYASPPKCDKGCELETLSERRECMAAILHPPLIPQRLEGEKRTEERGRGGEGEDRRDLCSKTFF